MLTFEKIGNRVKENAKQSDNHPDRKTEGANNIPGFFGVIAYPKTTSNDNEAHYDHQNIHYLQIAFIIYPEKSIWTQILASQNRPVKISHEDLISLIYYDFSKSWIKERFNLCG